MTFVSLADARVLAREVRAQIHAGVDPIFERRKREGIPTFREAAAKAFAENEKSWRNLKHRAQWLTSLETYAFPYFRDVSVSEIEGRDVRDALVAIWLDKRETARRVRQRIVMVMDRSIGMGYRLNSLPIAAINKSPPKAKQAKAHHRALPYQDLPGFLVKLRKGIGPGRLALEALILTATRSGEIRSATWPEIDLDARCGRFPPPARKPAASARSRSQRAPWRCSKKPRATERSKCDLVLPGPKWRKPLSDMTLTKICRDMETDAVPYGLRSTFSTCASEETDFDHMVAEMALAHTIPNAVEAPYRRGSLFKKWQQLMDAWSAYCCSEPELR